MSVCILISSCKAPAYRAAREQQYMSLEGIDVDIYYVRGKRELAVEGNDPHGVRVRVLEAPCGDNYEDITLKLWYGFQYLRNFYDVVIKIDENLIIADAARLVNIVKEESKTHPYGALKGIGGYDYPVLAIEHGNKVSHPLLRVAPAFFPPAKFAGSSYYLTSQALFLLDGKHFRTFIAEDYAIGYYLKSFGIDVYPSEVMRLGLISDRPGFDKSPLIATVPIGGLDPYYELIRNAIPNDPVCRITIHGGLGNQLFQLATALEYCLVNSKRLAITTNPNNIRKYYWDSVLGRFSGLVTVDNNDYLYIEPEYSYRAIPVRAGNIRLWGYFQSPKYFPSIRDNLLKLLRLGSDPISRLSDNIVIVHARRGDYLTKPDVHCVTDDKYYADALEVMERLVDSPIYILISDDIEYWKGSDIFKGRSTCVWSDTCDINTFRFMLGSRNFIIPNSTYSWWAAYLSEAKDKHIIVPNKWAGPAGPQDYGDVYTDDMIKIEIS